LTRRLSSRIFPILSELDYVHFGRRALVSCGGKGTMRGGRLHAKAVVFDRRIAFMGPANLTNKALRNAELCWHVEGPQVSAILRFMEEHLEASLEW